ncbi:hypothetical protein [Salinigranum salinum]|nr:hypothetical protein [Salinigranum salinum]
MIEIEEEAIHAVTVESAAERKRMEIYDTGLAGSLASERSERGGLRRVH